MEGGVRFVPKVLDFNGVVLMGTFPLGQELVWWFDRRRVGDSIFTPCVAKFLSKTVLPLFSTFTEQNLFCRLSVLQ